MIRAVVRADAHALADVDVPRDALVLRRISDAATLDRQARLASTGREGSRLLALVRSHRDASAALRAHRGVVVVAALGGLGGALGIAVTAEPRELGAGERALVRRVRERLAHHAADDVRSVIVEEAVLGGLYRTAVGTPATASPRIGTLAERVADAALARRLRTRGASLPPRTARPLDEGAGTVPVDGASTALAATISTMLGCGGLYDAAGPALVRERDTAARAPLTARDLPTRDLWRIVAGRLGGSR
ncbi:hypothetical protein [Demequina iriomotensis]|uniref:hypothetical protein n=1 Tax=Demequina iriomotensis TaxID=1536641 RepID=UPI000784C503|nr:hypothetical protein [Demequina iriomotensis]